MKNGLALALERFVFRMSQDLTIKREKHYGRQKTERNASTAPLSTCFVTSKGEFSENLVGNGVYRE